MSNLSVVWEDNALRQLETRDRYTRQAIREQFSLDPSDGAIQFDPDQDNSFLTPVSDRRFSVIWRLVDGNAVVRAVVPLPSLTTNADLKKPGALNDLKAYVQRAVQAESNGKIRI